MEFGERDSASSNPAAALVEHLGPLTQFLDEAVAEAIGRAESSASRYDHRQFAFFRPLVVRMETRQILETRGLPGNWRVGGEPRNMGQLILQKPDVMELRFLKGNPIQPGNIPHAGTSAARRAYWRQDALVAWPDAPTTPLHFLLVWNYLDAAHRDEGFSLDVAHPTSPGRYGRRVPCDLIAPLPRGGTMFEELKPFAYDDDENLFGISVAEEELL